MAGPDQIQAQFLKAIKHQVAPILTQLTNMMIASQCYPAGLVEGRTIPVYKGKSKEKTNLASYREVTTVSVLGKVVEKILAGQINENIEATMPINIFGYRPGRSTSEAVDWLMSRKSEKSPNVLVMTDAKNAFASLDHSLLLGMFECFGATNHVTKLMEQFLKRRSQFVQIGDEKSAKWSPDSGIYAGSVLSGV